MPIEEDGFSYFKFCSCIDKGRACFVRVLFEGLGINLRNNTQSYNNYTLTIQWLY